MKTLALLSILLAVALGLPLEQKEAAAPVNEAAQRPLVGDLVPLQGLVVVENPAPQPQLSQQLQMSQQQPDPKELVALQDQKELAEVQMSESVEETQVQPDLIGENEIAPEETLVEEVDLESDVKDLDYPEPEISESLEHDTDSEINYQMHDFEQPIMELEPLKGEDELQDDDELFGDSFMDNAVYEEPVMFLEPEDDRDQVMNELNAPQVVAMEGPDAQQEPFMSLEPEEVSEMLPSMGKRVHGRRPCAGVVLQGKCYQFFSNPKRAADAEFFCQENLPGGHLASITSSNIHNELMTLMRRNGGPRRTWVGGIRFLDTGRFVWLDGAYWIYSDWLRGEPNNTANVEQCVEVLASGKFNDFTCWEPQAFICSYPYQ